MTILATPWNLGGPDLLVIVLIATFLFGAKKLPELARSLKQSLNEFNKGRTEDLPSEPPKKP
jgi:sec-independent protein translocase protein TatA